MSTCVEKLPHSCGTDRGLQVFQQEDGSYNGHCFSCGIHVPDPYKERPDYKPEVKVKTEEDIKQELAEIRKLKAIELPERMLKKESLEHFGVRIGFSEQDGKTPMLAAFPYRIDGNVTGVKMSTLSKPKKVWSVGRMKGVDLFGWKEAVATGDKRLYITEGECFTPDTEIFTDCGWVKFADLAETQLVAQVLPDMSSEFVKPLAYVKKSYDGQLIKNSVLGFEHTSTPKHNMVCYDYKGRLTKHSADSAPYSGSTVPRAVKLDGCGIQLSDDQISLQLAVSADFKIDVRASGDLYCHGEFKKARKIARMQAILGRLGLEHTSYVGVNGLTSFNFTAPKWLTGKKLPESWLVEASLRQRLHILDEMVHWDGNSVTGRNQTEFSSKHRTEAEWMQSVAHTSGKCSSVIRRENALGVWYKTSVLHGKTTSSWQRMKSEEVPYSGDVYCVTVPSGMLLIRQNGKVTVTGNCDAVALWQVICESNKGDFAGNIPAVVSIPHGAASAARDIGRLLPRIRQHFKEVVLVFDMDEPGRKAAEEVCKILPEAMSAELPAKDANECLMEGYKKALFNAVRFKAAKPKNSRIVDAESLHEAAKEPAAYGVSWPWEYVTEKTRGIRKGETIYIGSAQKMGDLTPI